MIAAVSAAFGSHPLACSCGETGQHVWGNGFSAGVFERGGGALGIHPRAIARRLEGDDAFLEVGVAQVCESLLDGIKQALEARIGLGGALVQFGNVRALA